MVDSKTFTELYWGAKIRFGFKDKINGVKIKVGGKTG